jgi:large subunit ribosomal protein L32
MAVPRSRISKSKKRSRSAHVALKAKGVSKCSNCQKTKMPHAICPYCGFYAKRAVISQETAEK